MKWNAGTVEATTVYGSANLHPGSARSARKLITRRSFVTFYSKGSQALKKKKMRNSNREGMGRRKAPRRQVRAVQILNAALEANCPCVYVDALVNNYGVRFLLDTGSDITLLNEQTWKKMRSPVLERTSVVVKNAIGEHIKIHGKLKCKIKMKVIETEGYAYVTPYTLIGLEWIRANA
ncbi:Peptidase A2 domain-containing protein [Trichostrongylus colubriformis]|uniref:Peptidase A2 domain-containing protein n=1 Tax=Trichostrongylus colubriformis TaxID=6319 RepID=A0AAN8EUU9_TRICO